MIRMRLHSTLTLAVLGLLWNVPAIRASEIDRMWMANLAKSERLQLRAYGQALSTGQMPYDGLTRMRQEMTRQGFYFEQGSASPVAGNMHIRPLLAWDPNINGGVLQDRFVLNDLMFEAAPAFRAKSGLVVGMSVGGLTRYAWDEGRLVELRGATEFGWSPAHEIYRTDAILSACSRNHLENWNFLDLCASSRHYWRELGTWSTYQASAELSTIVSAANSLHEISLRSSWDSTEDANYSQIDITLESVWSTAVTELNVAIGKRDSDPLSLYDSVSASVGWFALGRSWNIDTRIQRSGGGRFLGIPREDRVRGLGIATNLRPETSLRLGYLNSRSTAGTANYDQVTLDIRFDHLRW